MKIILNIKNRAVHYFRRYQLIGLYIFFAGIATLVDLGGLYLLTNFVGLWYFYSAIFSFAAGMIVNYVLNKFFNFKNHSRQIARQFGLFMIVALIGLIFNQLIIYMAVEYFHVWYIFAKFISVFLVFFWSFYGHRHLTFRIYQ